MARNNVTTTPGHSFGFGKARRKRKNSLSRKAHTCCHHERNSRHGSISSILDGMVNGVIVHTTHRMAKMKDSRPARDMVISGIYKPRPAHSRMIGAALVTVSSVYNYVSLYQ